MNNIFLAILLVILFIISILIIQRFYPGGIFENRVEGFASDPFTKIFKFFNYLGKFFKWLGDIVTCAVETIIGLPNCFVFYVIDIIVGFFSMIIKFCCSFSPTLEKARKTIWSMLVSLDKFINKYTGYHIIQYPKSILKMCYKCRNVKMPKMKK